MGGGGGGGGGVQQILEKTIWFWDNTRPNKVNPRQANENIV